MKMTTAAFSLILLTIAGCARKDSSAVALAALDSAYKAHVLSKEEYETKRAAMVGQARALEALDKARNAGVLTEAEYSAKKALLLSPPAAQAPQPQPTPPTVAAQTPDPPVASSEAPVVPPPLRTAAIEPTPPAPAPGTPPPPAVAPAVAPPVASTTAPVPATPVSQGSPVVQAGAAQGHTFRMKMIKAIDAQGFERPMTSAEMLVPTDWQSQGGTTWNIKDKCNSIQTTLRASGPDGRGIEVFPAYNWYWADDSQSARATAAQTAQSGMRPCEVMPPMGASDYLRRILGRVRPGAQLVGIEAAPKLMQALQQQARQTEQSAAQYRLQQRVRPDAVKGRIRYNINGQAVEEWVIVATIITGTMGPSFDARSMQMRSAWSYSCSAYMTAERAPQGQLDASDKLFDLIVNTYRVNPQWQARVSNNAQQIQQIELKGVRDRSAIVTKNAEDIANIRREQNAYQQRSQDHNSAQYSEYQRGVETYRNPTNGETVELSNQYGHAWVNNRGEYLLSDQAGFDPGVTFKEDWKPLEHVRK